MADDKRRGEEHANPLGPGCVAVFFDAGRREIVVTLDDRRVARFPVDLMQEASLASDESLARVEAAGSGVWLAEPDTGFELSLALRGELGNPAWMDEIRRRIDATWLAPIPLDPPGTEKKPPRPANWPRLSPGTLLAMHRIASPWRKLPPPSLDDALPPLVAGVSSQEAVVAQVRGLVDAWRGFPLGAAREPYPEDEPSYAPSRAWEKPVSETTSQLLRHWFRHDPHALAGGQPFKYWPHQRRAVETFVYLHEACGLRRTEQLWRLAGGEPIDTQQDPWPKLGAELATGSGKTKVMSLLIAWSYLNALFQGESYLGLGRHSLLVAPGLFVRDRLLLDFRPDDGGPSIFFADPVLPPGLRDVWDLKVYGPDDCPLRLDPAQGALVVTNYHRLLNEEEETEDDLGRTRAQKQIDLLFGASEPRKLEDIRTPLLERFQQSRGLLVINDEAHRVGDEPAHRRATLTAKSRQDGSAGAGTSWIRALRMVNGSHAKAGRLGLQVDMSATLFEEAGIEADQKTLFRHTSVQYPLKEAKRDGIIKSPVLERLKASVDGKEVAAIDEAQPNAFARYRVMIEAGIKRWMLVREQMRAEGDLRKPILMLLCESKDDAAEIANMLTYGHAVKDAGTLTPTGFRDERTGETLFLEPDGAGGRRSTVVQVHIGEKENKNEKEWEHVRRLVHFIDRNEVATDRYDASGRRVLEANPYNVVVSVLMLREGWDVRGVKVIVPLRPCGSRTLTEQVLGRGLRKMHAPRIDDEGAVEMTPEELYVIEHPSFAKILDAIQDLVDEKDSGDIKHDPEYVPIPPRPDAAEREERDVRLVKYLGSSQETPDWRQSLDVNTLPALSPRAPWEGEQPDIVVETRLREAFAVNEEQEEPASPATGGGRMAGAWGEGQRFTLSAEPGYRDFELVLEHAYVEPMLRTLKMGFHHRTAVKGVVRDFLERRTFNLPAGVRPTFDGDADTLAVKIALGNLGRPDVVTRVREALVPVLQGAMTAAVPRVRVQLGETHAMELPGYVAVRKNVLEPSRRSPFARQAMANDLEDRFARWLDACGDVRGWVYNHRKGVGFDIQYVWRDLQVPYYPDFIARAQWGEVMHNFVIETKGRLDDRDKAKARAGVDFCDLLTREDKEPWHYLLVIENEPLGRGDMTSLETVTTRSLHFAFAEQEKRGLLPGASAQASFEELKLEATVDETAKYRSAVPAYDLTPHAGGFGPSQAVAPLGWVRVRSSRRFDKTMFAARVVGHSMEPGVPSGSWALFREYAAGAAPSPVQLDGRRVVVQLREGSDPETGGAYTLKRLRVVSRDEQGAVNAVSLAPDNRAFATRQLAEGDGDVRIVAELLEVLS